MGRSRGFPPSKGVAPDDEVDSFTLGDVVGPVASVAEVDAALSKLVFISNAVLAMILLPEIATEDKITSFEVTTAKGDVKCDVGVVGMDVQM